ncbi:hypothetical protein DNTS_028579, partial [Danionella cerebrum]
LIVPCVVPAQVECKAHFLLISVGLPPSGSEPRFEAIDSTGAYPVTKKCGAQCGYNYFTQPLLGRVVLRASYFSCHTENQNDEIFTFNFGVLLKDQNGEESYFNISETCIVPPFSPREVTCEENYMEVSVSADLLKVSKTDELPCSIADMVKGSSASNSLAIASEVKPWRIMLKQDRKQTVLSAEDAATLGYFIIITPGRVVFRTMYSRPHASVKMVNGLSVEVMQATVFFKEFQMVLSVDMVAACSLDKGYFDGYRLHWRTPVIMPPLPVAPYELTGGNIGMGVDGEVLHDSAVRDRGYSMRVNEGVVDCSIPFAAEGGLRASFAMNNVYNEMYTVQLTYRQTVVDHKGVATTQNVVRQMDTEPIPRPLYSVNQTNPSERIFTVYLGNVPFDVELVSVELNGHEVPVLNAIQMGYSISRVSEDNSTFAYILRVSFDDKFVMKQHFSGRLGYLLNIKWTLKIMPQMEPFYHYSSVTVFVDDPVFSPAPPVFGSTCAENGISFVKDHDELDHMWDITIGPYKLTPELASERGYIMTNDSTTLKLDVPLFTVGYTYEDITLKQFYGTFELLTRSTKNSEIKQSSAKRCLFKTSELLVCSSEGVMTVVSDLANALPAVTPSLTTLLDPNCRPQDIDSTRVLFSFGMNSCGTRVKIDQDYVTYENEIIAPYSIDGKRVITRDSAYRMVVRCIYPVRSFETLSVNKFSAETPGIGQIQYSLNVLDSSQPVQVHKQRRKLQAENTPAFHNFVRFFSSAEDN